MILKTGKDFSDKLINLYEETTETAEVSTADEANNISTVLAATSIDAAYDLLEAANHDLAMLINKGERYSISFENLTKVYNDYAYYANSDNDSQENPKGLLEFWTVIKRMVESKSEWSGGILTGNWTNRLVNAFYKPSFAEAGILNILQTTDIFKDYNFEFNRNNPIMIDEHAYFFSGPGSNEPDFFSEKLKDEDSRDARKPGTVECKPASAKSNIHGAAYVIRYTRPYTTGHGYFWFETRTVKGTLPDKFPIVGNRMNFTIDKDKIKLNAEVLDAIYETLCKNIKNNEKTNTAIKSDHNILRTAVEKQLDKVNELEKRSFIDADYSTKDTPTALKDATKQLNILINRKAEVASVLKEPVKEKYNMIKTDFMKLYESLSTLNEDAKTDASKEFWRLAKENILSVEDFHTAYDEELIDFGRAYLFNSYTRLLKDKSTYGRIKKLAAENPDNWAIKALLKFWVLQFSTKAKTKAEVDKEKAAAEVNEAHVQKYKEWTPSVLAELDQDLVKKYLDAWKIKVEDITYNTYLHSEYGYITNRRKLIVLPSGWSQSWSVRDEDEPKRENLVAFWTPYMLEREIERAEREEWTRQYAEKQKSNKVIDVFKNSSCKCYHAIVEGESGKLYYVRFGSSSYDVKSLSQKVGKEIIEAEFLCNVPESYKVIYTECEDRDSSRTLRTYSSSYYSWDSSNAAACKLAPKIDSTSGPYSDSSTEKVSSGDGKNYSLMDNIDSWAYRSTVDYNYD